MKPALPQPLLKHFKAQGKGKILFCKDDCPYNFWEYLCFKYGIDPLRTRQIQMTMPSEVLADTRERYVPPGQPSWQASADSETGACLNADATH